MFDIVTFGSGTRDILIKPEKFKVLKNKKDFVTGKSICFNLGSKVDIRELRLTSGGGGTNTAATFANQEFKVAFCGSVGDDILGQALINELEALGISTQFIKKIKKKATNLSVVINGLKEDRTILVYRGASDLLEKNDISWQKLKTKWLYIAPLSGKLCNIFEDIIDFAHKNDIKIAVNPGNYQLNLSVDKLKRILSKVDILLLNQEEASLLTKIPFKKEREIFKKIDKICPGIAIMTKGKNGVIVSDGKHIYKARALNTKIVDKTGAGDSFGAGFVSGYIKSSGNIEKSIQLGIANAAACLKESGAKNGLLKSNEKFTKVKVEKESCSKNNLCQIK